MKRPIIPTDPVAEQAKGRVALWLDLEDLRWKEDTEERASTQEV